MTAPAVLERAFEATTVRIAVVDGEPNVVAADACAALGISNVSMAVGRLDPDGVSLAEVIDSMGRTQQAKVLTEAGLYELILRSDKPAAVPFRRWVTREVLPEIRRTGVYAAAIPQTRSEALRLAADAMEELDAALARAAALTPSAAAWDRLADSEGDYMVGEAAKILSRDPAITTGQGRLFTTLSEWGWVYKGGHPRAWIPYQTQVDAGRLYLHAYMHEDRVCHQVRVTPKGLAEIHRRLGGSAPLALGPPSLFTQLLGGGR